LTPSQVVLLLRGISKGESSRTLAAELDIGYATVLRLRHDIQANAVLEQPETPLSEDEFEDDEMFQNAGKRPTALRSERSVPVAGQPTARAWPL